MACIRELFLQKKKKLKIHQEQISKLQKTTENKDKKKEKRRIIFVFFFHRKNRIKRIENTWGILLQGRVSDGCVCQNRRLLFVSRDVGL